MLNVTGEVARAVLARTVTAPLPVADTVLLALPLASVTLVAAGRLPLVAVQLMVAPTTGALLAFFSATTIGADAIAPVNTCPLPLVIVRDSAAAAGTVVTEVCTSCGFGPAPVAWMMLVPAVGPKLKLALA